MQPAVDTLMQLCLICQPAAASLHHINLHGARPLWLMFQLLPGTGQHRLSLLNSQCSCLRLTGAKGAGRCLHRLSICWPYFSCYRWLWQLSLRLAHPGVCARGDMLDCVPRLRWLSCRPLPCQAAAACRAVLLHDQASTAGASEHCNLLTVWQLLSRQFDFQLRKAAHLWATAVKCAWWLLRPALL